MKQYFAKYLPIEGELNSNWDGTWVRDKKGEYGTFILAHDIRAVMTLEESTERLEQVKLFLCNRDIQVGDEFIIPDMYIEMQGDLYKSNKGVCTGISKDKEVYHYSVPLILEVGGISHSGVFKKHNPYKILGAISLGATWVKEGDEFDENDISKWKRIVEFFIPKVGLKTRTYWGDRVEILDINPDFNNRIVCKYLDDASLNHNPGCVKDCTYRYHPNELGYTDKYYYKILGPCKHFH